MILTRPLLVFAALVLLPAPLVCAKGKPKPRPPAPAPAPAVPAAPPLPSATLQSYAGNNLEHLLGPLNGGALPRAELLRMEADYRGRLAQGLPEEKAMIEAALRVCSAFEKIMDEREKAFLGTQGGGTAVTSGALGATRTERLKDWRDELQAEREAREAKARKDQARASNAFVVAGASSAAGIAWQQRAQPWRKEIQQLLAAEQQAEIAAVTPPAPPVPARAAAPPAAPPAAAAAGADPVVGSWLLEGRSPLELHADHTVSGERQGRWSAPKSEDGKRHYQLIWPNDWVDSLVLSQDGTTLSGSTAGGKPIAARRP